MQKNGFKLLESRSKLNHRRMLHYNKNGLESLVQVRTYHGYIRSRKSVGNALFWISAKRSIGLNDPSCSFQVYISMNMGPFSCCCTTIPSIQAEYSAKIARQWSVHHVLVIHALGYAPWYCIHIQQLWSWKQIVYFIICDEIIGFGGHLESCNIATAGVP